jgi:hypothetical protein
MPAVNQSLVPYNPLGRPNYGDGTSYTNSIDAALAVAGQIGGALAVVPNSPAAMSVLVDAGYNLPQIGGTTPLFLNAGSSPVSVSLAAPGSNSYYATIYWDLSTNAAGVVYGATGTSPTPIMPDNLWQIPLAIVLITSTTTSIAATAIKDIRTCVGGPLTKNLGTVTTNQTVNCYNATSVKVVVTVNTSFNVVLSLTNLRIGVPVYVRYNNTYSTALGLTIQATTPSGVSYSVSGFTVGAASNLSGASVSVTAGTSCLLSGSSDMIPDLDLMYVIT